MKFRAHVNIMPREELLDPQGKATLLGLANLGISGVSDLRVGKRIKLEFEAADAATAESMVKTACEKLLANLIMETYEFQIEALEAQTA